VADPERRHFDFRRLYRPAPPQTDRLGRLIPGGEEVQALIEGLFTTASKGELMFVDNRGVCDIRHGLDEPPPQGFGAESPARRKRVFRKPPKYINRPPRGRH